jgi:hypothetical protein
MRRLLPFLVGLLLGVTGCTDVGPTGSAPSAASAASPPSASATTLDPQLRRELLTMAKEDQRERHGEGVIDDSSRIQRLKEIFERYGWPGYDLVGHKGGDAAWLVAQHADLDLAFQKQALGLLQRAVEDGQASPGNFAYLQDRVAVAEGRPQQYGTQVACGKDGTPQPRTPVAEPSGLDRRRAEAGLPPYAAYVRKMTQVCSGDRAQEQ